MQLSREDVRKVAGLAKLDFADSELDVITEKLHKTLNFVAQLNEVDTTGVQEMAHPFDVDSVTRPDERVPSLEREAALSNAPNTDGEFFLVPPVLG